MFNWKKLNSALSASKNNFIYVYGDWWFHINDFDSGKSLFLQWLVARFYGTDNVPRALGAFTTGCVKQELPSLTRYAQWRHGGDVVRFGDILNIYCLINVWYTKLFSHKKIWPNTNLFIAVILILSYFCWIEHAFCAILENSAYVYTPIYKCIFRIVKHLDVSYNKSRIVKTWWYHTQRKLFQNYTNKQMWKKYIRHIYIYIFTAYTLYIQ